MSASAITRNRPIPHSGKLLREVIRADSDAAQQRDAPNWQPLVFNGAKMCAVQGKSLHATIPAIRNHQDGIRATGIHEEAVWRVEFAVTVARPPDFSKKFSVRRKSQQMVRAVAITYIKVSV